MINLTRKLNIISARYALLIIFISISNFLCGGNNLLSTVSNGEEIFFYSDTSVSINSIDALKHLTYSHSSPEKKHPQLEYTQGDTLITLSIADYVKYTYFNGDKALGSSWLNDDFGNKKSSLDHYKIVGNYLIILSDNFNGMDLLLWKKGSQNQFHLLCVFPNTIGQCLYCYPEFLSSDSDTIIIGDERNEEGSIDGGYKHFIIRSDSLLLVKEIAIQGHGPWDGHSNPTKGAICKSVLYIYYDDVGNQKKDPIIYECYDKNLDILYGKVISDTLELYQMYWQGMGDILKTVHIKEQSIKVGEIMWMRHNSYIAIEYEYDWYWVRSNKIKINVP